MSIETATPSVYLNELTSGFGNFTLDLYQECIRSTDENVIFSPVSILTALTLLSQATNGKSFDELKKGLYLSDDKTVTANLFQKYQVLLNNSIGLSTMSIANQIYVKDGYSLNDQFKRVAEMQFSSGVESLNFGNNVEAAQRINHFVEKQTNDKIKNLIKADSLNDDTGLVLVNAVYFKSNWKYKFDKKLTKKSDFFINQNEKVSVDFMQVTDNLRVRSNENLEATVVELPYANSNFSFIIVLPNERTGLSALENKLKDYNLKSVIEDLAYPFGYTVIMPKFKVEFEIKLNDALKNLGICEIFDPEKADLSGLFMTGERLYVSDVVHKAFIEVNEEGSEAAGATLIQFAFASSFGPTIPPAVIYVNHPFLYYIWDKESRTAIFNGRIMKF